MSNYTPDRNGRDYGDYVGRLGKTLQLCKKLEDFQYPVSLSICVLQSVLTVLTENVLYSRRNILESMRYAEDIEKIKLISEKIGAKPIFGIDKSIIVRQTFNEELDVGKILGHIRNALSHPTSENTSGDAPRTGFYAIQSKSIEQIVFVDSPDTKDSRMPYKGTIETFDRNKIKQGFPESSVLKNGIVYVDGKQFRRYIQIKLSVMQLIDLVAELCEYTNNFLMHSENPVNVLKAFFNRYAA